MFRGVSFAAVRGMALTVIQSRRIRLFLILPILSAFPPFVRPLCPASFPRTAQMSTDALFLFSCVTVFSMQQFPAAVSSPYNFSLSIYIWERVVGYNKKEQVGLTYSFFSYIFRFSVTVTERQGVLQL